MATAADKVRNAIRHRLGRDVELTGAALRRAVAARHRAAFDHTLASMVRSGEVIETPAAFNGHRYQLRPRRNNDRPCDRCKVNRRRASGRLCGSCLAELAKASPGGQPAHNGAAQANPHAVRATAQRRHEKRRK